ncbi:kinesin-like protein KIN-7O [Callorhinchus milii]|uniref:kinesin-like protein KIN-7O n=1 Tax=Callorhinchus milii TaxID=7868 RepID=UPI001C3F71B7|nr:kinesin-like protein KIN-7O [Callorhinchus milii]
MCKGKPELWSLFTGEHQGREYRVVFALSTPGCQHIPYRESKLTRILRDCLGGNCLMSLVVTVSSSSASVHETLSTLQFAARARSITNHAGKNIQLQSSKDQASPLQTCLPPIHAGRSASSRPTEKSLRDSVLRLDEAKEHPSQRVVLPHLEKASEKALKTVRAVTNSDKSKGADDRFRNLRSRPNPLVGSVDVLRENKMEKQQHKLDKISGFEPSSAKAFTETIPFEIQKNAECANCKKEKKIRDEYDKFILQSKRDKESLQQRIVELEAELTKPQQEVEELAPAAQKEEIVDKLSCLMSKSEQNKLEEENRGKQKQIEHLENEVEHLQKSLKYYQKLAADEKEIHQTYIIQLQQDELLHTAILQERVCFIQPVKEYFRNAYCKIL